MSYRFQGIKLSIDNLLSWTGRIAIVRRGISEPQGAADKDAEFVERAIRADK
jgi:hypothetical protein